jgi:hypothetical protein
VELFSDAAAMAAGTDFQAYNQGPNPAWHYEGCGPQAIDNVLSYYGIDKTIQDVAPHVTTIALNSSNIASTPDAVAGGLQAMLNAWGDGVFTVQRLSGADMRWEVRNSLEAGDPVIMLVQGGGHYQVATGLLADEYHVIDYVGKDAWVSELNIGFQFGSGPWAGIFGGVDGGYQEDTLVKVSRAPKP